jgi:membrane protease YdiL (CAAX protease family)
MVALVSFAHIFLAVCIYFAFAVSASWVAQKAGLNLKDMASRTSSQLLLIGAAANLGALLAILILMRVLDAQPVSALGLSFQPKDRLFSISATVGTFGLAVIFLTWLKRGGRFQVTSHEPVRGVKGTLNLVVGLVVLFCVALQEEVLYRGYVFLNLAQFNPLIIVASSTLVFVAIHFLTNRVSVHQILSWLLSGLVLGAAYLISGSIWVPILIHFAIDATNVLIFNITGQFSFYTISPALTERDRTAYRVAYGLAMVIFILIIYGPVLRLS